MKLSDVKPCASCGGPLLSPPMGQWYCLRISSAMINPRAANAVLGTMQILGGALHLAEVMAPGAEDAIWVLADKDPNFMTELHVCLECASGLKPMRAICEMVEIANRAKSVEAGAA